MDVDDELRRMFANTGDQLDVPVRPDAEQTIVAGANRRRKRRLAAMSAGGAAAVVVVVALGIALAEPTPDAMPPALTPTSTSSTPTETSVPTGTTAPTQPDGGAPPATGNDHVSTSETSETSEAPPDAPEVTGEVIGPFGYRELRLGMSYEEAAATGLIEGGGPPSGPGCNGYQLATTDGSFGGQVNISPEFGVEFIAPYAVVHTPEGVSEGWTTEQFLALYPEMADEVGRSGSVFIPIAENPGAEYRIDGLSLGSVQMIALQLSSQTCYTYN